MFFMTPFVFIYRINLISSSSTDFETYWLRNFKVRENKKDTWTEMLAFSVVLQSHEAFRLNLDRVVSYMKYIA